MRPSPANLLAPAPAGVRASMLAAPRLEPGAAAVVGRFFAVLAERGEPVAAPSRAAFDAAAASEPTLATLLRALAAHAPQVGLAGGRDARKAWYARRPKPGPARRRGPTPPPAVAPSAWPIEWALLYPALLRAPVQETTRRRYLASVDRLAAVLPTTDAAPDWSRYMACSLLEALLDLGTDATTVGNYLDGLICLGKHGGIGDAKLAGLREMRAVAKVRATIIPKKKVARLAALTERGGFLEIASTIGQLRSKADALPASSAAAERLRKTAAVLAVEINAFGRTGDVALWRIGIDLVREPWGAWRLDWEQGKTALDQDLGELWPEIGEIIDEHILGGRPRRYAALRYSELVARNWLTLTDDAHPSNYPSALVKKAIGVPLHDLRTLLADLLRRVDPATARRLIQAMLGHGSQVAGEAYRAGCEGDASARDWQQMRRTIAGGEVPA
jgi:hypothetical protein